MTVPLRHPIAVIKERPFDGVARILPVDWSREVTPSIAQILAAQTDLPARFALECVARVNGDPVPRAMWAYVRPKGGAHHDVVVTFALPLQGGGGGGSGGAKKNPIATVASVAVLLAAAAVSGGALALPAAGFLSAGAVNAVAGMAVGLGGALAVAALAPPPTLSANQGSVSADNGTNAAASLSGNVLAKGAPIPRVIGTMQVFPPIITPPLIEIVGDTTVGECVYGLAGPHALSNIMVGTTTAASIAELATEIQEGLPNSPVLSLIQRQSFTDTTTAPMSRHVVDSSSGSGGINLLNQNNPALSLPQWEGRTSRVGPDEIWVAFNLPAGLSRTTGDLQFLPFRVRFRQQGQTAWINGPEFHYARQTQRPVQFALKLMFQAPPAAYNAMPDLGGPVRAYVGVPLQNQVPLATGGWAADSYFYTATPVAISGGTGTNIGTLSGGSGLAAAFNGTPNQSAANSAASTGTGTLTGSVGKNWSGTTRCLSRVTITAPNDTGFTSSSNKSVTLQLQGSMDGTTWGTLYSETVTSSAGLVRDISSGISPVGYRRHQVVLTEAAGDAGSHTIGIAQVVFYGSGDAFVSVDNINATSGVVNVDCFTDRIQLYLNDPVRFPKSGNWEIQVMRGQSMTNSVFTRTAYLFNSSTQVLDFFGYTTSAGIAQAFQDQTQLADDVEIIRVSSIWNVPPVPKPDAFAVIAAKVTGRSIDQVSVLASSYVRDWDGGGWNTWTTSSNPAPHLYDVLTGTLGASPLPALIVDNASILALRTQCINQGYTCNAVVEGKTYIDVATMIAASGYARLSHSETWGVFLDRARGSDAPVQVFTPRNMNGFTVSRAFALKPTGIRASFNDASNNYQQTEIIVYADPDNPDNSRLEQMTYDGLVNQVDVIARANFDLLQAQLRFTFYKGKADIESIVCRRGDLVGVQYDIIDNYAGFSRIQSIQRNGSGQITGLILDGSIPVTTGTDLSVSADLAAALDFADFGAVTGVAIRLKGGNGVTTKAVTASVNDDVTTIAFVTPFADPGTSQLDAGCLVTAGRLGSEYRRLIVYAVNPSTDMSADVTCVDEAPELWATALIDSDGADLVDSDSADLVVPA